MQAILTEQPTREHPQHPMGKSPRSRRLILLFVVAFLFFVGALLAQPWRNAETVTQAPLERSDRFGQALKAQNAKFSMNDIERESAIAAPLHLVSSREEPAQTFKDILVDATVCLAPRAVAKLV